MTSENTNKAFYHKIMKTTKPFVIDSYKRRYTKYTSAEEIKIISEIKKFLVENGELSEDILVNRLLENTEWARMIVKYFIIYQYDDCSDEETD